MRSNKVDHVGLTVPDLDQALRFFVDVMGCAHAYDIGPVAANDDWMTTHLGLDARSNILRIAMLTMADGAKLELFQYEAPDQNRRMARNSDWSGHHVAFNVADMDAAVAHLRSKGVALMGEPTTMTSGPTASERWCYFKAPWGLQLEIVQSVAVHDEGWDRHRTRLRTD